MKKFQALVVATIFFLIPLTVSAQGGLLQLPAGTHEDAIKHNQEGIAHFKMGNLPLALKHFELAEKNAKDCGEVHYNQAVTLDKLGNHGEARNHFRIALHQAKGNQIILTSPILHAHIR